MTEDKFDVQLALEAVSYIQGAASMAEIGDREGAIGQLTQAFIRVKGQLRDLEETDND